MTPQLSADDNSSKSTRNISVQLLTQADFDAMSETRQAFIRDRIRDGQVKIVSAEDIAPPPSPQPAISVDLKKLQKSNKITDKTVNPKNPKTADPTPKPPQTTQQEPPKTPPVTHYVYTSPIRRLLNKSVKVVLNNGQIHIGVLSELWQFEIILKVANDAEFILMKHAITSIEENKTNCQTLLTDGAVPPASLPVDGENANH